MKAGHFSPSIPTVDFSKSKIPPMVRNTVILWTPKKEKAPRMNLWHDAFSPLGTSTLSTESWSRLKNTKVKLAFSCFTKLGFLRSSVGWHLLGVPSKSAGRLWQMEFRQLLHQSHRLWLCYFDVSFICPRPVWVLQHALLRGRDLCLFGVQVSSALLRDVFQGPFHILSGTASHDWWLGQSDSRVMSSDQLHQQRDVPPPLRMNTPILPGFNSSLLNELGQVT